MSVFLKSKEQSDLGSWKTICIDSVPISVVIAALSPSSSSLLPLFATHQGIIQQRLEPAMAPITNGSAAKGKIVVCRDMGEEAMGILQQSDYEVSRVSCE
jgi:hypothetical protein